ncbi:hypothetical protein ACFWMT_13425 [Streptomyces sp. NPDC058368]|uniref:hypothetical protein n=1 Tax=Streptomyces sp. NPDC058368 TaxID=3346461 RepID=UPI003667A1F2
MVGSWSDPDEPIAGYNPDGSPVPPTLLTAQERQWSQEGRRRGLGPVRLVALTDDGQMTYPPDAAAVEAMVAGLRMRQYVFSID